MECLTLAFTGPPGPQMAFKLVQGNLAIHAVVWQVSLNHCACIRPEG